MKENLIRILTHRIWEIMNFNPHDEKDCKRFAEKIVDDKFLKYFNDGSGTNTVGNTTAPINKEH